MENPFALINIAFFALLLGVTWWYAKSTSRLLQQAQNQVSAMERQTIAKIEELDLSYTQILNEIEERQQTEERLRISEARFAAFMRHLPGTASMRDDHGRYLFANETWEKVFDRELRDWREKNLEEVWPAGLAHSLLEMDQKILKDGQPLEKIETLEQNGVKHFWLINRFPIVDQDDRGVMVGTIGIDITARRQAEEALRDSEQKLRSLTTQLLLSQENERKRLAAELHDELGHSLLILKLRLESLQEQLRPEQDSLKNEVRTILQFIADSIGEVRRLYLDLSPGDLEDLGLTAALHSMLEDFVALQKTVTATIRMDDLDGLFTLPTQTAIYRVVQEALTNIGKHAKPTHISLEITKAPDKVSFILNDDGAGFEKDSILTEKKTLGLLSMEERVKILGGSFELWSQEGQGTRVLFTIPLDHQEGGQSEPL